MATALVDTYTQINFTNNHVFVKDPINNGFYGPKLHHGGNNDGPSPKELIGNALRERVENVDHEDCAPGEEDTFFVADLGEVYRQHLRWKRNLGRVKPFYGKLLELLRLSPITPWPFLTIPCCRIQSKESC